MSRGIIYVMSTAVDGLVKIGKTGSDNFEQRMAQLEGNGYRNVTGLSRRFAIELDDYDEKELLLDSLFARSRVGKTELFSLDLNEVVQLLSSFEGKVVYPSESKAVLFEQATEVIQAEMVPNGLYHMSVKFTDGKCGLAKMQVVDGHIFLKAGSFISNRFHCKSPGWKTARESMQVADGVLQTDFECYSLSMAAALAAGYNRNGWINWRNDSGDSIDVYRSKVRETDED